MRNRVARPLLEPGPAGQGTRRASVVLSTCLFVSGCAALIYEVLWLRLFSLVMGHTVYALSTVLTAFLGGLALGAYLGGRWTRRRGASVGLYAGIELAIAVSAVAMPWLIEACGPVFGIAYRALGSHFYAYTVAQFVFCGLMLLPPTILMGATLPLVTALLVREGADVALGSGRLYALNSAGGVVGAALAGFLLLPSLGMRATGLVAIFLNVAVAGLANVLSERTAPPARAEPLAQGIDAAPDRAALVWASPRAEVLSLLYGLSGFVALTLEVGWARVVSLSIGSTIYGFTIILVTYIAGLAAGSFLGPRIGLLSREPVRAVFLCHGVISLWSLASLPYLGSLPLRILDLVGAWGTEFDRLVLMQMALVFVTIAIPTLAMGGMFPLIAGLWYRSVRSSGLAVGSTYAANTLGSILGSLIAGFVLVPAIGMRGTIVASAVLGGTLGIVYLLPSLRARPLRTLAWGGLLSGALMALLVLTPVWDREVLTSAPYLYGKTLLQERKRRGGDLAEILERQYGRLIDYREGATTVVTVRRKEEDGTSRIDMFQNGVRESIGSGILHSFIAHLPLLLHGGARHVLVVGLGGGTTLGSVLKYPVEAVDCVEISPEVRDMARRYFAEHNDHALDDPRVRLTIGDGRNHLRHSDAAYDVVVSQPSYPWMSGAASLFTRDYFADVKARLAPGGLACSWFLAYSDEARLSIVRAWLDVFPDACLFELGGLQGVLVGLRDGGRLSASNVLRGLRHPVVAAHLRDDLKIARPAELFGHLVAGPETLRARTRGVPANTDDNAHVESQGLRGAQAYRIVKPLFPMRDDPTLLVDPTLSTPEQTEAFARELGAIFERRGRRVLEGR